MIKVILSIYLYSILKYQTNSFLDLALRLKIAMDFFLLNFINSKVNVD